MDWIESSLAAVALVCLGFVAVAAAAMFLCDAVEYLRESE